MRLFSRGFDREADNNVNKKSVIFKYESQATLVNSFPLFNTVKIITKMEIGDNKFAIKI